MPSTTDTLLLQVTGWSSSTARKAYTEKITGHSSPAIGSDLRMLSRGGHSGDCAPHGGAPVSRIPKTQRLLRGGDVVSPEGDNPDVSVPRSYCKVITAFNCKHETSRGGFAFVKNNAPPPTSIMGNMVSDLPISVRGRKKKFCHAGPETPCRFLTCSRYPA